LTLRAHLLLLAAHGIDPVALIVPGLIEELAWPTGGALGCLGQGLGEGELSLECAAREIVALPQLARVGHPCQHALGASWHGSLAAPRSAFCAAKVRLKVDHRQCVVVAAKSPNRTADEVA
jgi:hypothetical protein